MKEKQAMSTNQSDRAVTKEQSRKKHKQAKKQEKKAAKSERLSNAEKTKGQVSRKQLKEEKKLINPNRRAIPICLRLGIVLSLSALARARGIMLGHGMLGDGAPLDVLQKETWQHIIDIVNKKE